MKRLAATALIAEPHSGCRRRFRYRYWTTRSRAFLSIGVLLFRTVNRHDRTSIPRDERRLSPLPPRAPQCAVYRRSSAWDSAGGTSRCARADPHTCTVDSPSLRPPYGKAYGYHKEGKTRLRDDECRTRHVRFLRYHGVSADDVIDRRREERHEHRRTLPRGDSVTKGEGMTSAKGESLPMSGAEKVTETARGTTDKRSAADKEGLKIYGKQ